MGGIEEVFSQNSRTSPHQMERAGMVREKKETVNQVSHLGDDVQNGEIITILTRFEKRWQKLIRRTEPFSQ